MAGQLGPVPYTSCTLWELQNTLCVLENHMCWNCRRLLELELRVSEIDRWLVSRQGIQEAESFVDSMFQEVDTQQLPRFQAEREWVTNNRKFIIANGRVGKCAIIFCNDAFCEMCGYSRAEVMQKPGTCDFLHGPQTRKTAVSQIAQALRGSEERKVELFLSRKDGSCFLCLVDVVPVRSESGSVIMFILNFEVMLEEDLLQSLDKELNHKLPPPWISTDHGRGFKLKFPKFVSLSMSKLSLPQEEPEVIDLDVSRQSSESLTVDEMTVHSQTEDLRALIDLESEADLEQSSEAGAPLDQSSLKQYLTPQLSYSSGSLSGRQRWSGSSKEGLYTFRRVSSVDDIGAVKGDFKRSFRSRHSSTGAVNEVNLPPNLLNSTSDSDLMKYRTISKIPQITLNIVDFKGENLILSPPGELEILAPCKVKERTHNVTEKVTQVSCPPSSGHSAFCLVLAVSQTQCAGWWSCNEYPAQWDKPGKYTDVEIYRRSFIVAGSKSWNSLPNSTVGEPSPHGLQQFKKAAHHHLLEGN
ncbi:potassium voltage-gated channel subfamily H member 2 [Heptranchias perlo]|uniref:potassium voltage-gated channel subfamily H member 2 n=1 Tax=Heptranchias perlo TaxID=212740 RepID=UPI003559D8F3